MFRRKRMLVLALALATGACEDPGGSDTVLLPPFTPGTYSLSSIGGQQLPTPEPCSGLRADQERFVLNADRTAQWTFRLTNVGTGQQVTYAASGSYVADDEVGVVAVNLTYTAGNSSRTAFEVELRRTAEGLTQTVGNSCGDTPAVKLYRLIAG